MDFVENFFFVEPRHAFIDCYNRLFATWIAVKVCRTLDRKIKAFTKTGHNFRVIPEHGNAAAHERDDLAQSVVNLGKLGIENFTEIEVEPSNQSATLPFQKRFRVSQRHREGGQTNVLQRLLFQYSPEIGQRVNIAERKTMICLALRKVPR